MKRSQREAVRARNEEFQQKRAQVRRADPHAQREAAVEAALARAGESERARVDRLLVKTGAGGDELLGDRFFESMPPEGKRPVFVALARKVAKATPRVLDPAFLRALGWMSTLTVARPVEAWRPRGKARETIFRSLADHVLAHYPTPAVLWEAFFSEHAAVLTPLVGHVASGGSLHEYVKSGFPVPLTRRMCHELLATPAEDGFMVAVRSVQIHAAGGDARFLQAWMGTRQARALGTREDEAFWATVIEWFARMGMLDAANVGPIADYLEHRRRSDPGFSMKGRSALAVLRELRSWHADLAQAREIRALTFRTSGFREAVYDDLARKDPSGKVIKESWRVEEILTSKALAEEGRRMGHCVYSYAGRIEAHQVSIWTLTMRDGLGPTGRWAMLTVEVRNDMRAIVQVRGRFNRAATPRELSVLSRWAKLNELRLAVL